MEKTKFEIDCEKLCAECMNQGFDLCNAEGHCKDEVEFARCGVCGGIYCSEEALTELNVCASCLSRCSQNVDANNEIVNKNLFAQHKCMEIKHGGLYEIPVGSKVKYENEIIECFESPSPCYCKECFFHQKVMNFCLAICRNDQREDHKNVIFKRSK